MALGKLLELMMSNNKGKGFSEYKVKILLELSKDEPLTITQIQKKLKISYKEAYRHVKELSEKHDFIKRDKQKNTKHSPVNIYLTNEGKEIAKLLKNIKK